MDRLNFDTTTLNQLAMLSALENGLTKAETKMFKEMRALLKAADKADTSSVPQKERDKFIFAYAIRIAELNDRLN
ncbi:MAG: hypothetical protein J6W84_07040 [Bacteroidales bacterium]|nr:hypothetical protein [Bacteroidales bacterium]